MSMNMSMKMQSLRLTMKSRGIANNICNNNCSRTISTLGKGGRVNNFYYQKNTRMIFRSFAIEPIKSTDPMPVIDESSWAAESLGKMGEKLAPAPTEPIIVEDADDYVINKPTEKVKKVAQTMLTMNFLEIQQLMFYMQKRLGMTDEQLFYRTGLQKPGVDYSHLGNADAGATGAAKTEATAAAAAPVAEKTQFDLKLKAVDAKVKIKIIKEVRTITGLGLKEAKELVEKAPVVIKQNLKKDEIEAFKKVLLEAGAEIEVI